MKSAPRASYVGFRHITSFDTFLMLSAAKPKRAKGANNAPYFRGLLHFTLRFERGRAEIRCGFERGSAERMHLQVALQ